MTADPGHDPPSALPCSATRRVNRAAVLMIAKFREIGDINGNEGSSLRIKRDGSWTDFAAKGDYGDILDFVRQAKFGGDISAARQWARDWLGLSGNAPCRKAIVPAPNYTTPVWAMMDAGELGRLPYLHGVDALTVAIDNDASGAEAYEAVSQRWLAEGIHVLGIKPKKDGWDLNDTSRERVSAHE